MSIDTDTKPITRTVCHPDANHTVVRARGQRVRRQCSVCQSMSKWEFDPEAAAAAQPKIIKDARFESISLEPKVDPSKGIHPIESVRKKGERNPETESVRPDFDQRVKIDQADRDRVKFEGMTVADIKARIKSEGLGFGGASKKAEYIDVLIRNNIRP